MVLDVCIIPWHTIVSMKRSYKTFNNGKPSAARLMKKQSLNKKETWALYGLNRPPKPRYEGLKGVYWAVVSEYVRRRDFGMWGTCVSCGKNMQGWQQGQAGHFIAAGTGGFELLFDLNNIHLECGYCNGVDGNHLVGYERTLDKRYGKGFAKKLKDRYVKSRQGTSMKSWNDKRYNKEILKLQSATELL